MSYATFSLQAFSQGEEMPMTMSHSDSQETITSYKDALIKAPLLVSQAAVVGIAFNHFVFSKVFPNRIRIEPNKPSEIMQKDTAGGDSKKSVLDNNLISNGSDRIWQWIISLGGIQFINRVGLILFRYFLDCIGYFGWSSLATEDYHFHLDFYSSSNILYISKENYNE